MSRLNTSKSVLILPSIQKLQLTGPYTGQSFGNLSRSIYNAKITLDDLEPKYNSCCSVCVTVNTQQISYIPNFQRYKNVSNDFIVNEIAIVSVDESVYTLFFVSNTI